jgi:hypothetical protein
MRSAFLLFVMSLFISQSGLASYEGMVNLTACAEQVLTLHIPDDDDASVWASP